MIVNKPVMAEERFFKRTWKEAERSRNLYVLQDRARSSAAIPTFFNRHERRFYAAWGAHGDILRTQRARRWAMRPEQVIQVRKYYPEYCNGIWHHTRHPGGKYGRRPHSSYSVCDCGSKRLNSYLSSTHYPTEDR